MYSGTTLTPISGRILGAHQKIDRLSRNSLRDLIKHDSAFPETQAILHFEGANGPDAIKRKSPAHDEPWHFMSPFDQADTQLVDAIEGHYDALVTALKNKDADHAAFEAAWLAHALVDGLTPAHHYPYKEKLAEIRNGEEMETRDSLHDKFFMPGDTRTEQMRNNWKMWGPRGLMSTHGYFELGAAALIVSLRRKKMVPHDADIADLQEYGLLELFRRKTREIAAMDMYEEYYTHGWTPKLGRQVRRQLAPISVQMVTLAWYAALIDAGIEKPRHISVPKPPKPLPTKPKHKKPSKKARA